MVCREVFYVGIWYIDDGNFFIFVCVFYVFKVSSWFVDGVYVWIYYYQ